jgi:hypothetical protein
VSVAPAPSPGSRRPGSLYHPVTGAGRRRPSRRRRSEPARPPSPTEPPRPACPHVLPVFAPGPACHKPAGSGTKPQELAPDDAVPASRFSGPGIKPQSRRGSAPAPSPRAGVQGHGSASQPATGDRRAAHAPQAAWSRLRAAAGAGLDHWAAGGWARAPLGSRDPRCYGSWCLAASAPGNQLHESRDRQVAAFGVKKPVIANSLR